LAKETGRAGEFEKISTPVSVLYRKFPHLADRWAEQKAKQSQKGGPDFSFQDFLDWLKTKQKISENISRQKTIEGSKNRSSVKIAGSKTEVNDAKAPQQTVGKTSTSKSFGDKNRPAPQRPNSGTSGSNCPLCNQPHPLELCTRFKNLEIGARVDLCQSKGMCFVCLSSGHIARWCARAKTEKCKVCGSNRHHTLVHREATKGSPPDTTSKMAEKPATQPL
jgi:hypothetical protein